MKVSLFLLFASVSSFVSKSEALLGRSSTSSGISRPEIYNTDLQLPELAEKVSADLQKKFHVVAKIETPVWKPLTTAIEKSLVGRKFLLDDHENKILISGVTRMKVTNVLSPIRKIRTYEAAHARVIDLTLEVPQLTATVSTPTCPKTRPPKGSCYMEVVIEKLSIDLQTKWTLEKKPRIAFVSVSKVNVGSIRVQSKAPTSDHAIKNIPVGEQSGVWQEVVTAVKSGVQGSVQNLLGKFVESIFV